MKACLNLSRQIKAFFNRKHSHESALEFQPESCRRITTEPQASDGVATSDGLFRFANGDLAADPNARLQDGVLEGSNVSPMVAMISAARQFEHQMKMIQTSEKQEQTAAKLLAANG
jgi:flagellar basal body rod protein FlgF